MTTPDVTQLVADLRRWLPAMRDAAHHTAQAIQYTFAHTTGLQADSQPERATYARDRLERDLNALDEIAAIHYGASILPSQRTAIFNILELNARTIAAWPEHRQTIEQIHARWQQVCEPQEETSTWLCPSCGTAQLRWRHAQRLYACPACEYAGTPDNVSNMRRYVITQADVWISKRQAIELFGFESRQALDHHIKAGHLDLVEGQIHTAQLRGLRRNS